MKFLETALLGNPTLMDAALLCLGIWLLIVYRHKSDLKKLLAKKNEKDHLKRVEIFVRRHPFSQCADLLRLSLIHVYLPGNNIKVIHNHINRLWVADVMDQGEELLFATLILLQEYGYDESFNLLKNKILRCKKSKENQYFSLLSPSFDDAFCQQLIQSEETTTIFKGVVYYLLGKKRIQHGLDKEANEYFQLALGQQENPTMHELLRKRGYVK